jgi:hypothetical protein
MWLDRTDELPVDRGEEWRTLDWLMPAWARQLADPNRSAGQWLGLLWGYFHEDLISGRFDDTIGRHFLRVIDRCNRQFLCVEGRQLHGILFSMADSIFVTKKKVLHFARWHGLPPPSLAQSTRPAGPSARTVESDARFDRHTFTRSAYRQDTDEPVARVEASANGGDT